MWMACRREAQKRTIYFSSRASNSPFDVIYKGGCTHNHCIGYFNSIQLLFADIEIIPQYVNLLLAFLHFFFFFFNILRTLKYRGGPGLPEKPCSRDKQAEFWQCYELIVIG